jgi:peptidoglycan biosynthesis protein MviN/MurJ (putative lipid II flippase)
VSPSRLLKWKYSPSLLFAGTNTFCGVVFQLGALYKMGVGAHSDLYYASILIPTVLYALAFGALNNVLVPMFVEAKAHGNGEEIVLFWNCMIVTVVGGLALLTLFYYPVLLAFPLLFRKLAWLDLRQVSSIFLTFSLYQIFFIAVATKNCFLFARGRPVFAQTGILCGWLVSLALLSRFHGTENLARIPLCLLAGNAVALLFPNLGNETFFYRPGLLKLHTVSVISRIAPITAGTSVSWLEPAVDGVIASTLKQGSLTIYYFFGRVMFYIATAVFSGYIQPVTKHLSELAVEGRWRDLRHRTNSVALHAALLGLGLWACSLVAFLLLGIANVSFLRTYVSAFSQNFPVFLLLVGYLFGALGYVVYSNSLYVLRRERLFLIASLATFSVGILLKLAGARMFGLKGLAAGTSAYWMSYAIVLLFCFIWAARQRQVDSAPAAFSSAFHEPEVEL